MHNILMMQFIIINSFASMHACRAVITITWWRMFRNPACGASSLRKPKKFWRRISHPQTHTTTPSPPKNSKHTLSIHFLLSYVSYCIDSSYMITLFKSFSHCYDASSQEGIESKASGRGSPTKPKGISLSNSKSQLAPSTWNPWQQPPQTGDPQAIHATQLKASRDVRWH